MTTPVPDATSLLQDYLGARLAPVRVSTRRPNPSANRYVQIRLIGGGKVPPVRYRARFDVFAWGDTEPEARALILQAQGEINALIGTDLLGVTCYEVEETMGPRASDDPLTNSPRYWMTEALVIRADAFIR